MPDQSLQASLMRDGYVFVHADVMRRAIEAFGRTRRLAGVRRQLECLDVDTYMADGGRYRRRRHAVYGLRRLGRDRHAWPPGRTTRASITTR